METDYRLKGQGIGVQFPVGGDDFLYFTISRPVLGAHPAFYHSPPSSTEVKNTWIYTSTPSYLFLAQCVINLARGALTYFTCIGTFERRSQYQQDEFLLCEVEAV
jgi:hypothetical protein